MAEFSGDAASRRAEDCEAFFTEMPCQSARRPVRSPQMDDRGGESSFQPQPLHKSIVSRFFGIHDASLPRRGRIRRGPCCPGFVLGCLFPQPEPWSFLPDSTPPRIQDWNPGLTLHAGIPFGRKAASTNLSRYSGFDQQASSLPRQLRSPVVSHWECPAGRIFT